MAISVLPHPPAEAPVQLEQGSDEQRKQLLAYVLATKHQMGYEIESETEFGAVIFTPSPRRWLRTRTGQDNERITIRIREDGTTNIDRSKPTPPESTAPEPASTMIPVDALRDRVSPRRLAARWRR
jgi:hypothetical protein